MDTINILIPEKAEIDSPVQPNLRDAYTELENGVYVALETYSNVHRGSGHYSKITTYLYEQAREVVLDYLGLNKSSFVVIFCTPRRASAFVKYLDPGSYSLISSLDLGLSIGIRALAVRKEALHKGIPCETGGGNARLISRDWVIWAKAPERFEAGTPAIINVIAFAKALGMTQKYGKDIFKRFIERGSAREILYDEELNWYSGRELLRRLNQMLIGKNLKVPTIEGDRPFINLDNSASTPTFVPIWEAYYKSWKLSDQSKQEIIEEVKSICSEVIKAPQEDYDMIFTSNTTEAINLASESMGKEVEMIVEPIVLTTILEHSSNDLPWRNTKGTAHLRLTVDAEGFVDLKELETLFKSYNEQCRFGNKKIRLLAVSGASNILGTCNPLAAISTIAHRYGVHLLVDAAQLTVHRKIDMEGCGIDYLAFSAHKLYAPFGSGMLIARKGLLNFSYAEKEQIQLSGEENVGGIAALGKALYLLNRIGFDVIKQEEQALTSHALAGMKKIRGLTIYGIKDEETHGFAHKIGVIVFEMKGISPKHIANELALQGGIGVRYGCHCAHMIIKQLLHISPSLEQFQRLIVQWFPKLNLPGLVRISFGIENTMEEVDTFISVLRNIAKQPVSMNESPAVSEPGRMSIFSKRETQLQIEDLMMEVSGKVFNPQ